MKKILLVSLLVLLGVTTHAQFNQGRMMIGGTIGFSADKSKPDDSNDYVTKSFSYSFAPSFGYFVIDNFAVGLAINNSLEFNKPESSDYVNKWSNSSTEIQPFVRYYLPVRIFFHGEYGIGFGRLSTDYIDEEDDDDSYTPSHWSLAAGYAIMLNDHVAIEPMIGYKSSTMKNGDYKSINSGLFLQAGFQVYLGRK